MSDLLAEARMYAIEGRESHVRWAEHLEAHADGTCESCTPEVIATAGDATVQREWVRKYDIILAALALDKFQDVGYAPPDIGRRPA